MEVKRFTSLKNQVTPEMQDQKLKDVAQLYEKQFLREMVKSMRATVHESGFVKSNQAEQIFREQLDHEYVEKWGQKGGIGLADMIYKQLIDKYGEALGITRIQRPQGPIQFSEKEKIIFKDDQARANQIKKIIIESPNGFQNRSITNPWGGEIKKMTSLDVENHFMEIFHKDAGVSSEFHFTGINSLQNMGLKVGDEIPAGQRLGLLSPEARRLYWNVNPTEVLNINQDAEKVKNSLIE